PLARTSAHYGGTLYARASYCISERRSSILMPMFRADLLKGKKILVTGGGTGLGKSIARRYLQLGAELVICGRRADVRDATVRELAGETGGRIESLSCDVRDAEQVESMMSRIWERGPLDILVNNAAANFIARTEKLSPRAIDAVLNIV